MNGTRRTWGILLAAIGAISLALAIAMMTGDRGENDQLASIAGVFVGLASLVASVLSWLGVPSYKPVDLAALADDLAATVRDEWTKEADARKVRGAQVLPLTWHSGGRVDRLADRFDRAQQQLVVEYRKVKSGRLVVLGEPGSGKTVLAMVLLLGLLADRVRSSPVPVLLSASSWDPLRASFDKWVVDSLAAYYNGRTETAQKLLDNRLILPVVDGIDEIPEVSRREAVRKINRAIGLDRPVVLTCRQAEYDDLIEGGFPALLNAPVCRIRPLDVDDIARYLKSDRDSNWAPVIEDITRDPESSLSRALSTPLMVSLVRIAFSRGGEPAELITLTDDRHSVEDYIVDRVVDAVYRTDGQEVAPRWSGHQARRWLEFLARYLHAHRERDLVWWQLADRLVSPWVAPMLGVVLGTVVLLVVMVGASVGTNGDSGTVNSASAIVGAAVALVATALWFGTSGRRPGRIELVRQGSCSRLRRGFLVGAAFILVPGIPVLLLAGLASTVLNPVEDLDGVRALFQAAALVVAIAFVAGCAVAIHHWLDATAARSANATPGDLVRQDRRAAIVSALAAGVVASLLTWPVIAGGLFTGEVFGQAIGGALGLPGTVYFSDVAHTFGISDTMFVLVVLVVVPLVGIALLVLVSRAWSRFIVARATLALTRRLPWCLLGFLADARERGLLRQVGGVYQFRHIRLQEQLARQSGDTLLSAQSAPPIKSRNHRRRRVAIGLTVACGATLVATTVEFNGLRCEAPLSLGADRDRTTEFTEFGRHCIGVVAASEWADLKTKYDVVAELDRQNKRAADHRRFTTVALLLPFGLPRERNRTLSILEGVVLAQQEAEKKGEPIMILPADTGPNQDNWVALERATSYASAHRQRIRATVGNISNEHPIFDDVGLLLSMELVRAKTIDSFALRGNSRVIPSEFPVSDSGGIIICAVDQALEQLIAESNSSGISSLYSDPSSCDGHPFAFSVGPDFAQKLRKLDPLPFANFTLYYPDDNPKGPPRYSAVVKTKLPDGVAKFAEDAYYSTLYAGGVRQFSVYSFTAESTGWTIPKMES